MKDGVVLLKALDLKIDDLFPHIGDKKVSKFYLFFFSHNLVSDV